MTIFVLILYLIGSVCFLTGTSITLFLKLHGMS